MKQIICFLLLLCCSIAAMGKDPDPALLRKAQAGDAKAQYGLACFYLPNSKTVSAEGIKWLTKAAENGNAMAQWKLQCTYKNGWHGLAKNDDKYVYWLTKLANNNDLAKYKFYIADGQYDLGELYEKGEHGLEKNISEYLKWAKKAVGNDSSSAAFSLGLYYKDLGDKQEAIYWFKKTMDIWWQKRHEEHDLAFDELRELGVTYHPAGNVGHSDMASRNSSASTVKGNANKLADIIIGEWRYRDYVKNKDTSDEDLRVLEFYKDGTGYLLDSENMGLENLFFFIDPRISFHWHIDKNNKIIMTFDDEGGTVDVTIVEFTNNEMIQGQISNGKVIRLAKFMRKK